ncbi:pyridoxal phosphate-dependent aminotransferase family protein [Segetibacter sp. 3557_3]|uniref:aminotransferase class I/II-fold pyridoxal phosphate-dependent enzyme n=1 Tax=Segetibacter sp. 3557_3 TaxID=2547429 RepID=UPI001058EE7B|nr:aminotransferase class I/II-fold pyridoxal phosphate-dependent enzyme [Segetibacter sp. 3557_3]TDH28076.1 pyridoxal phosphate-dependent aminotransferase family protein [Segetibacter sp. 3557_3]
MTYLLERAPGRTTLVNGKEYLFFSGYSYLGIGHHPGYLSLVEEGLRKYGLLHPSSRLSNTRLDIYDKFEKQLSWLTGSEETVTFSSGFLAGKAIVDLLAKNTKNCFVAPDTHPAIQNGIPPLQRHWKKEMVQAINESDEKYFILLADSVSPLKACVQDFSFLSSIKPEKRITCIIDDSHGIGCLGPGGEGISHSLPRLSNVEFILTYSLSKALHINGGAVSCSHATAALLRQSPYFTSTTPIAPPSVYAYLNGQHIYFEQLRKLKENIALFIALLKDVPGIINHPALPIFLLKKNLPQPALDSHRLLISSFSYPDPSGTPVNRLVVNALHTETDLRRAAWILQELLR